MVPFRPEQLGDLEWIQTGAISRFHELRAGDSVFAQLEFRKTFGSLATGKTDQGVWTFKRRGFLHATVGVRVAGSDRDLMVYEPNWSGRRGHIQTAEGATYSWESVNFWGTDWVLAKPHGPKLAYFRHKGVVRSVAEVELTDEGRAEPELALLLLLGWYLILLYMMDAATASTAAIG